MTSVVSGTTGTTYCATPISTLAAHEQQRGDEVGLAQPADRPVPATRQRPAGRHAGRAPGVRGGDHRPDPSGRRHCRARVRRTARRGRPHRRLTGRARDRNVGWQRGHQNRLRPASTSVRTVAAAHEARLAVPPVDVDRLRRGRRRAAARPDRPPGEPATCTVSIRPRRTPSAISATRSCHIGSNCPRRSVLPGPQRVDAGAGTAARRGRRCRRRPAPSGPSAGRRSGPGCAVHPRPGPGPVGVRAQRVGPEPVEQQPLLRRGSSARRRWRRAGRRTPAGARRAVGHQPQPDLADGRRRPRPSLDGELAVEPEVHVHERSPSKSTNRCLP